MALYVGLMSGTSMDAVDAALIDISIDGLNLLRYRQYAYPKPIVVQLREARCRDLNLDQVAQLDVCVGSFFGEACMRLLEEAEVDPLAVTAIGSHGQTLRHRPDATPPYTLQVGDPNRIAQITGISTVSDFRRMDMALGGQGAPLTPAFHQACFGVDQASRVVLNIGGIANITILPREPGAAVQGFDTGPGNALMDDWIRRHKGAPMDLDGRWAASGRVEPRLLSVLLDDPYLALMPPKSICRGYFDLAWLERHLASLQPVSPADVQATLLEYTAETIARAVERFAGDAREVLVCGGGCHNRRLMDVLAARLPTYHVKSTADVGMDPDAVEAAAFAWLAWRRLQELPGSLPSVTGARGPAILGAVYEPPPPAGL